MKKFLFLLLIAGVAGSGEKVRFIGHADLNRFIGEQLDFSLSLRGVSAAKARMLCDTLGIDRWLISADISTKFWADLVFPVHNIYQTFLDRRDGRTAETYKKIKQKNLGQEMHVVFDYKQKQATGYSDGSRTIRDSLQTLFAMLYHLRAMDLSLHDSVFCLLEIESQWWQVAGKVRQGEKTTGPFSRLEVRDVVLTFSPHGAVVARPWKTDLLTNRIARSGRLLIRLGPAPENLPIWIQIGEAKQTVTLKLNSCKKV